MKRKFVGARRRARIKGDSRGETITHIARVTPARASLQLFFPALFHKLTSAFSASVLLLIINFVNTLSEWLWIYEASESTNHFDNVMTKFIVNNRTDALKTDIHLTFTTTNCRIFRSRSLTRCMNLKFMRLSAH